MRRRSCAFLPMTVLWLLLLLLQVFSGVVNAGIFSAGSSNDLYGLLGVSHSATKEEIKKAFRRITREHHPDMQDTVDAKEVAKEYMARVLHAYKILSDDIQRQDYDQFGAIPGEQLNTAGFTAEEIFTHFQQHSPIVSKTRQLESLQVVRKILNFRGNRLFLVQVYDDTCKSCRWFSSMWESFAQSSLVEGGVVEMLRIDAFAQEGPMLLSELGIKYRNEVDVFAFVDGKKWGMPQLQAALKTRRGETVYSALMEFVTDFFYDKRKEITSLGPNDDMEAILKWLQEERSVTDAVRVLVPPLMAELVALTLSVVHDGVAVFRSVSRTSLLGLVENYCHEPIEVRDRNGELLPMPEFVVISTVQLNNNTSPASAEDPHATRSCKGVTVGASAALTFKKAEKFLQDSLPPRHPGMSDVAYITGTSFYELCRRHCLLLLRESCEVAPSDAQKKMLQGNYKPFVTGYICMECEPDLLAALPPNAKNALVAVLDGNDEKLHLLPDVLEEKDIAETLSYLLRDENEGAPINLAVPLSRLLTSQPFNLSQKQYWYMCFLSVIGFVYPFISNCYPFFIMFITHKLLQRFNLLGSNDNGGSSGGGSNSDNSNTGAAASVGGGNDNSSVSKEEQSTSETNCTHGCTKSANGNKGSCNEKLHAYNVVDLKTAQSGKGFLLLLLLHDDEQTPALPAVAHDPRFTVRIVSPNDVVWSSWVSKQRAKDGKDMSEAKEEVTAVAIRKGKMMGTVKPPQAKLESWLFDLLDGTVIANASLPEV